ncbi:hypothetical protein TcG_03221 [Trypanosoma cruzi]|nr:hypothetical protein TcG_03221 [Trypanosoma cruzi]
MLWIEKSIHECTAFPCGQRTERLIIFRCYSNPSSSGGIIVFVMAPRLARNAKIRSGTTTSSLGYKNSLNDDGCSAANALACRFRIASKSRFKALSSRVMAARNSACGDLPLTSAIFITRPSLLSLSSSYYRFLTVR